MKALQLKDESMYRNNLLQEKSMLCEKLSEENAKLRAALAAERLAHNKTKNLLQDSDANKGLFLSNLQQKTAKTRYSASNFSVAYKVHVKDNLHLTSRVGRKYVSDI